MTKSLEEELIDNLKKKGYNNFFYDENFSTKLKKIIDLKAKGDRNKYFHYFFYYGDELDTTIQKIYNNYDNNVFESFFYFSDDYNILINYTNDNYYIISVIHDFNNSVHLLFLIKEKYLFLADKMLTLEIFK